MQITISKDGKYTVDFTTIERSYPNGPIDLHFDCSSLSCNQCLLAARKLKTNPSILCYNLEQMVNLSLTDRKAILQMCKDNNIELTFKERLILQ